MAEHSWNDQKGFNRFEPPKLTPQQRDNVGKRRYNGESVLNLAREFNVHRSTILNISKIEN